VPYDENGRWRPPTREEFDEQVRERKRADGVPEDTPGWDWMSRYSFCVLLTYAGPPCDL
jgi:hypothetical protein